MSHAKAPQRVAILRFGAAGDVLLTAAIVRAMRRAWPAREIVFVTHARNAELLAGWTGIERILALRPKESVLSLRRRLRAQNVGFVLDLHGSWRSRLLSWLGGRAIRAARWRKRSVAETLAVRVGHAPYRPHVGQVRRYHTALEELLGHVQPEEPHVHVPHPRHLAEGRAALAQVEGLSGRAGPIVLLNPGAAWATKRWPVTHFAALAQRLLHGGLRVLVLGSPAEAPLVDGVVAGAPGALKLSTPVSLAGLAGIFEGASALVTGDSGPMHMARGMQLPCVVLFGSTPAEQFDLTGHAVVTAPQPCSPCSFFGRPACPRGHLACMTDITPESVYAALKALVPALSLD